jgi:hypothetical protein
MKFRPVTLVPTVSIVARLRKGFLFLEYPPGTLKNSNAWLRIPEKELRGKTPDRAAAQWCLSATTGITLPLDAFSRVTEQPIEGKDKLHHVFIVDIEQTDIEHMNIETPGVRVHFYEVKKMLRHAMENKIRTGNSLKIVELACALQASRTRSILTTGDQSGADFVPVEA